MVEIAIRTRHSTVSALKSPNFRLYFAGQLISLSGIWMQNVAQGYLVFSLTQSELWLGIVACAAGLPTVLMSPVAGVIVERVARRRLLTLTQTTQMCLAFVLFGLTLSGTVQVWQIVVLAFILGVANAIDFPARQSFIVEMVGREDLHSGIALNSILNSTARVLGPTAAGIALVQFGAAWCFFINGMTFVAVLISLAIMHVPYAIKAVTKASAFSQLKEGLRYARRDPLVAPILLLAAINGFFMLPVIQLLPAFADVVLDSPKEGYAALSAALGVGSVIAGVLVGGLTYRLGYGRIIALTVAGASAAIVLLALQRTVPLAAIMSALVGLFPVLQAVSLNTLLQTVVPDAFRGRVIALLMLAFVGFAPFGSLLMGAVANVIGISITLAICGLLSGIMGAAVLLRWPHFVQQASRVDEIAPQIAQV